MSSHGIQKQTDEQQQQVKYAPRERNPRTRRTGATNESGALSLTRAHTDTETPTATTAGWRGMMWPLIHGRGAKGAVSGMRRRATCADTVACFA